MTVARGVNEHEVGEVLRLGLDTSSCLGLAIQPVLGSGRAIRSDPRDRVTPTGVLRRLGEQTEGLVTADDFIPLPCSHRDCCDITYPLRAADDTWRSISALVGKDEPCCSTCGHQPRHPSSSQTAPRSIGTGSPL